MTTNSSDSPTSNTQPLEPLHILGHSTCQAKQDSSTKHNHDLINLQPGSDYPCFQKSTRPLRKFSPTPIPRQLGVTREAKKDKHQSTTHVVVDQGTPWGERGGEGRWGVLGPKAVAAVCRGLQKNIMCRACGTHQQL